MTQTIRTVLWRGEFAPLMEYCTVSAGDSGVTIAGSVVLVDDEQPQRVEYQVICDTVWRTQTVAVRVLRGLEERRLDLVADPQGRWWSGGHELEHLRGCIDVDLGTTPVTNTLPIRRLNLRDGQSQAIEVAWVLFPGLEVVRANQIYTRLDDRRYRYENGDSSFSADLDVDELGLVTRYAELWTRLAQRDETADER